MLCYVNFYTYQPRPATPFLQLSHHLPHSSPLPLSKNILMTNCDLQLKIVLLIVHLNLQLANRTQHVVLMCIRYWQITCCIYKAYLKLQLNALFVSNFMKLYQYNYNDLKFHYTHKVVI